MPVVNIDQRYTRYQLPFARAMRGGKKRASLIWHRRLGKDYASCMYAREMALKEPGNYWHCLPKQTQAREAMWDAINPATGGRRIDELFPPAMRIKTNEQKMAITIPSGPGLKQQSIWSLKGSDSYNTLVGSGAKGVVFSEYPLSDPVAWALIQPMIEANNGWAVFNGTPRGKNHAYNQHMLAQGSDDWHADTLTSDETDIFSQKQLDGILAGLQATYGKTLGDALFEQEYYCSFESAVLGSVYGEAITKLRGNDAIGRWPHIPGKRCIATFDIGRNDATVVWVGQVIAGERRWVHCYQMVGDAANPDRVVKTLRESEYDIAVCVLPHDAEHKTASNRGEDYKTQVMSLGYEVIIAPNMSLEMGIAQTRKMLGQSSFNEDNCNSVEAPGIDAINAYHYDYNPDTKILGNKPVHDWSSHYCDSLRYAAVSMEKAIGYLEPMVKNVNIMQKVI